MTIDELERRLIVDIEQTRAMGYVVDPRGFYNDSHPDEYYCGVCVLGAVLVSAGHARGGVGFEQAARELGLCEIDARDLEAGFMFGLLVAGDDLPYRVLGARLREYVAAHPAIEPAPIPESAVARG